MKAEAPVDTLADTLDEDQAETLGDKSRNVEVETLLCRQSNSSTFWVTQ